MRRGGGEAGRGGGVGGGRPWCCPDNARDGLEARRLMGGK